MNYVITLLDQYSTRIIGYNNSGAPLGQRDDLNELLIISYQSNRADYLAMFVNPPTLDQLLDPDNTFTQNTANPDAKYEQMRIQFETIPGQTQYPYPGQADEATIKAALAANTLISLTQEGSEMYVSEDPDDMAGLDPATGVVTWNTPAPEGTPLKMILIYQKTV